MEMSPSLTEEKLSQTCISPVTEITSNFQNFISFYAVNIKDASGEDKIILIPKEETKVQTNNVLGTYVQPSNLGAKVKLSNGIATKFQPSIAIATKAQPSNVLGTKMQPSNDLASESVEDAEYNMIHSSLKTNIPLDEQQILDVEPICKASARKGVRKSATNKSRSDTVKRKVSVEPENPLVEAAGPETHTLVFLDLETTGLPQFMGARNVQITEISMIAVSKFDFMNSRHPDLSDVRVKNKINLCVKPRCQMSAGASDITGLTNSNLFRHQEFDECIGQIINNFISRLPQPVCLLAHNGDMFDFPLLKSELDRVGTPLPPTVSVIDTIAVFRACGLEEDKKTAKDKTKNTKKRTSFSLKNIYVHFFEKEPTNIHDAQADCETLMMICRKGNKKVFPWIEKNKASFQNVRPMW